MADKSPFFKQILELEKKILARLATDDFCDAAAQSLSGFDFSTFEGMSSLRECLPQTKGYPQFYPSTGFGKFNLTLANNGQFFIVAMFMDDISTEIHDHPFEGVFTPLKGSPVQLSFTFKQQKNISPYLSSGELTCTHYKVLSPGDVVTINKEMIHMLERPTGNQFSLLICRLLPPDIRPNYFYLYPGLKIKNREGWAYLSRIISSFQDVQKVSEKEIETMLSTLATDELIQLFFRVGPELADKSLEREEIQMIRDFARKELMKSDLWNYVESHMDFLHKSKAKVSVLVG